MEKLVKQKIQLNRKIGQTEEMLQQTKMVKEKNWFNGKNI